MRVLILLIAVGFCQAWSTSKLTGRIVNGDEAAINQFSWQVGVTSLKGSKMESCGGSLIHPKWVLTAAHCIKGKKLYLTVGSIKRSPFNPANVDKVIEVEKKDCIIHEKYIQTRFTDDVALIKLPVSLQLNESVQTIKISKTTDFVEEGVRFIISGWGKTENGSPARNLKYAEMIALSQNACKEYFKAEHHPAVVDERLLCAQSPIKSSVCHGDSGGPIIEYQKDKIPVQVGVISFISYSGCLAGGPSGYMRLSAYRGWIESSIGVKLP